MVIFQRHGNETICIDDLCAFFVKWLNEVLLIWRKAYSQNGLVSMVLTTYCCVDIFVNDMTGN